MDSWHWWIANLLGGVELDASIMDSKTLRAGAMAGVRKHKNPISIARKVMEKRPHVLLVCEGADHFTDIVGMHSSELLTENAKDIHRDFMEGKGPLKTDYDTPSTFERKQRYWKVFEKLVAERKLMDWYRAYSASNYGTVNVIGRDQEGNLCCGVSTSGLSFKMPGTGTQPSWQGA